MLDVPNTETFCTISWVSHSMIRTTAYYVLKEENKILSQETLQPYISGCSRQVWRLYEQ